jgi:hypothetical protein
MDIMRMGAGSHWITGVTMKTVTLDTVRPPRPPPTGVRLLLHHPMHKIIKFTHDS